MSAIVLPSAPDIAESPRSVLERVDADKKTPLESQPRTLAPVRRRPPIFR
jgi:hypothetical protein